MTLLRINAEASDVPVSVAEVANVVSATELFEVRLDEVHAGPVAGAAPTMQFKLNRGEPGYAYLEDNETLLVRLEHTLSCFTESAPQNATNIVAYHVMAFRVLHEMEVTSSALGAWIETNAYFLAYPYVRQFFTQITGSLGLPPVVLGYVKREEWPFVDGTESEGVTHQRAEEVPVPPSEAVRGG